MGVRRFGRVNWLGTWTLGQREVSRFLNVWSQTIAGPLVTAGLLLMIFAIAIGPTRGDVMGYPFITFIAPGLMGMTIVQQAFANPSSSIMSAKAGGNIVDTLMPPLSPAELVTGYILGAIARGLVIAAVLALAIGLFLGLWPAEPLLALAFVVLGSVIMGGLGLLAGIFAQKFDQLAAVGNFIVTPLAFLSGTFYSITALPSALEAASRANPIFYTIDGIRHGMLGVSDAPPALGLAVCGVSALLVLALAWRWFATGYRLKA